MIKLSFIFALRQQGQYGIESNSMLGTSYEFLVKIATAAELQNWKWHNERSDFIFAFYVCVFTFDHT